MLDYDTTVSISQHCETMLKLFDILEKMRSFI